MDKALIIKKPFLDKIFNDGKVWEMRSSRTTISGRIGLIEQGSGHIVGEAYLLGCLAPIAPNDAFYRFHKVSNPKLLEKWKYPWVLANVIKYKKPIPYTHPKGAVVWVNLKEDK